MAETILDIVEIHNGNINPVIDDYAGFIISTDNQQIFFGIQSGQQCCEIWGYIASDDDFTPFIGTQLIGLTVVDAAYNQIVKDVLSANGMDEASETVFINIETSIGVLQFAVYNSHNGYYGHVVRIISQQLNQSWTV